MKRVLLLALLAALTLWYFADDTRRDAVRRGTEHIIDRVTHPDPPAPPPPRPAAPAGTPYLVDLVLPPADAYHHRTTRAPDPLRRAGLDHAPALTHAARELAHFYADHGRLAPSDALAFILDAAGAPYWGVRQTVVIADDPDALVDALRDQTHAQPGPWHAGLAELHLDDPPRTLHAALFARPALHLDPIPRAPLHGDALPLRARLDPAYGRPALIIETPDGQISDHPLDPHADPQTLDTLLTLDQPGRWQIELLATGPQGPVPLTQLTLHVDDPLPDHHRGHFPPADPDTDPTAHLEALIATDRQRYHRPPLTRDPALDAIAAAHSADMRARDYVGHHSPTTGTPRDRLDAAGQRPLTSGENVALNRHLQDAHAGLMRSLGHRRNILAADFTHLGLGVARGPDGWYVTQLFTRPAPDLTAPDTLPALEATLRARIDRLRADAGHRPLTPDRELTRLARAEAARPAASPRRLVESARRLGPRYLAAWTWTLADPDTLELPDRLLGPDPRQIGLALHPHPDRDHPLTLTLITAD